LVSASDFHKRSGGVNGDLFGDTAYPRHDRYRDLVVHLQGDVRPLIGFEAFQLDVYGVVAAWDRTASKIPCSLVIPERTSIPVFSFRRTTPAPATTVSEGSLTLTVMVPLSSWAKSVAERASAE
jgi:hypothetical protein